MICALTICFILVIAIYFVYLDSVITPTDDDEMLELDDEVEKLGDELVEWMKLYKKLKERSEKLEVLAIAAKWHLEHWQIHASHDCNAKELLGTAFDPAWKPDARLGLREAIEELEKE